MFNILLVKGDKIVFDVEFIVVLGFIRLFL